MISQSINDYEERLKSYIMNALVEERFTPLQQVVRDLMHENPNDSQAIHVAYTNVKKELTGLKIDKESEEEICEQFKRI